MRKDFENLIGLKFNKLTVIEFFKRENNRTYWLCKCECGNIIKIRADSLKSGKVFSCGCYAKKIHSNLCKKLGESRKIHGLTNTRLHKIWCNIKSRCNNKNNKAYKNYGARNIKVCDEWLNFENFYNWAINNGYEEGLTIDRIDVNGNYEPDNCRWATKEEQSNNRRNNHIITYNNETHTLSEWAKNLNINYKCLYKRIIVRKWSIKKAFNLI